MWSGWRAAETIKGAGGAKALAPEVADGAVAAAQ